MIQPEDDKTKDLFEMDFTEIEKRILYQQMRALISGAHTGAVFIANPRMTGRRISTCIVDECMPFESAISSNPLKPKKAQWKNERSVFNRVNQGKKSK